MIESVSVLKRDQNNFIALLQYYEIYRQSFYGVLSDILNVESVVPIAFVAFKARISSTYTCGITLLEQSPKEMNNTCSSKEWNALKITLGCFHYSLKAVL